MDHESQRAATKNYDLDLEQKRLQKEMILELRCVELIR